MLGFLHRVPILRGWTSGFSVGLTLVLSAPPPVPFFPKMHEELTRLWKAPFTARNKSFSSSPITTLDGGAALGYTGIPSVEGSMAMKLCPTATTTLRGDPCLPSRACKYSSGLTSSAYRVERWLLPSMPWRYCRSTRPKP